MKKITLLFTALIISSLSYAQYFVEGFEGGTVIPPAGWTHSQTNANETWVISANSNSGLNSAQVSYDAALGLQDETLTSPVIDLSSATNPQLVFFVNLSYFWAISPNNNYDAIVSVFDGANTTQIWEEADLGVFTSFEWIEVTLDLSAYAGNSTVQLLFNYTGTDGASLNIDDIRVEEAPSCPDPVVSFDDFSTTTVDISTDTVGTFDVEWGEYPYTQGSGGSTAIITNGDTYQISNLTPGVSYNVFVRQDCGFDGDSSYVEVVVGTTPDLTSLPLTEDLEPDANQLLLLNLGLSFNNNTGNWSFGQDDTTDGDTTNDFANSGVSYLFSNSTFTDADADATFYIGPFDLTTANEYTFTFSQRNLAAASPTRPNKDIEIIVATANDGSANTVLQTLDDLDNLTYVQRMATFTPSSDGAYYFGVRDKSNFFMGITEANVVILDDLSITSQLSVDSFEANAFTHNYNKELKTLNLESFNGAMTKVDVFSLLGQNVISKPLSNTSESIDVSSLNDGVYLAKVIVNGNSKTIKFIKN